MVFRRLLWFLLLAMAAAAADKKTTATAKGENDDLMLTVTVYLQPDDIKRLLDNDLDNHFIVCEVKVEPKYGKEVAIDRDDFLLRTYKDGEKSKPFDASQIAGSGALVISQDASSKSPGARSPGWTGMGGPMILGGGAAAASTGGLGPTGVKADVKNEAGDNPLKQLLESRILPNKKTAEPVTGLLYFGLEKQKMKDLQLDFGDRENRIALRFKN
jgi:hypothetical protein